MSTPLEEASAELEAAQSALEAALLWGTSLA